MKVKYKNIFIALGLVGCVVLNTATQVIRAYADGTTYGDTNYPYHISVSVDENIDWVDYMAVAGNPWASDQDVYYDEDGLYTGTDYIYVVLKPTISAVDKNIGIRVSGDDSPYTKINLNNRSDENNTYIFGVEFDNRELNKTHFSLLPYIEDPQLDPDPQPDDAWKQNYTEVNLRQATNLTLNEQTGVATATYEHGSIDITGESNFIVESTDWDYGDNQMGTMWRLYVENGGTIHCNVSPEEGYDVRATLGGQPLEVQVGDNEYAGLNPGEHLEVEFSFEEHHNPEPGDDIENNSTATFDYTFAGTTMADFAVNNSIIVHGDDPNIPMPDFDENNHANFERDYYADPESDTVTFYFATLWTDVIDEIVINGTSYDLPSGHDELQQNFTDQMIVFVLPNVPKSNLYTITTNTHEITEEEIFLGNFLWDNDETLLDDPNYDGNADDVIGHGTIEFISATYNNQTVNSVDELNEIGGVFGWADSIELDGQPSSTGGAMFADGTIVTVRLIPEKGYQLTSFGINGGQFEAEDNTGEYTFEVKKGNGHLAATFTPVDDVVNAESEKVSSGTIVVAGDDDQVSTGTVRLDVKDIELTPDQISNFEEIAGDYEISTYLDISLYNTIYKGTENEDDAWDTRVDELSSPATITLQLEEGVDGNSVVIVHEKHDGTYEIISTTYDATTHTITFRTSSFSNYAIAYSTVEDTEVPDTGENPDAPDTGENTNKQDSVATNYNVLIIVNVALVVIGLVGYAAKRFLRK